MIYSSSSASPSPDSLFWFLLLTLPALPPPYGELWAKSMCFWESNLTMKDGTLTICLPTAMCLWVIKTLAWWIDLAKPNLKTWVCNLLSKKSSGCKAKT